MYVVIVGDGRSDRSTRLAISSHQCSVIDGDTLQGQSINLRDSSLQSFQILSLVLMNSSCVFKNLWLIYLHFLTKIADK